MAVDAAQKETGMIAGRWLAWSTAVPRIVLKACLQDRGRLLVAFVLGALAASVAAVPPWQAVPQEVTLELHEARLSGILCKGGCHQAKLKRSSNRMAN